MHGAPSAHVKRRLRPVPRPVHTITMIRSRSRAHALEMGVNGGVNASATADEQRCTVTGSTFSVAC